MELRFFDVQSILPQEVYDLIAAGSEIELIDVRTPAEFEEFHAVGAKLLPLDLLDPIAFVAEREDLPHRPLFVLCKTGVRAGRACELLIAAGAKDLFVVEGGTKAWEAAGLPINYSE